MTRIGILVVAFNAESTLAGVIDRIPQDVIAKVDEIFVFDDASTDNTYGVGVAKQPDALTRLEVRRNHRNLMYGGNQKAGYQYAIDHGFDIVVLLHGDGQYAPEVMQQLLSPLESGRADMVMGSRMLVPGAARRGRMPLYKFVGNRILSFLQNQMLRRTFSEFHSGYRAYSVQALREIPLGQLTDSWHFDTQIILEFIRRGFTIEEVPIPTYYGDEISHVSGIPYAINCLKVTAAFAIRSRLDAIRGLPTPPRPAK